VKSSQMKCHMLKLTKMFIVNYINQHVASSKTKVVKCNCNDFSYTEEPMYCHKPAK